MSRRPRSRGQSLAEFAIVFPLFATLLFAIIDVGRFVQTANALNNGAREAARYASVANRPEPCTSAMSREACATMVAREQSWGVPPTLIDVVVSCSRILPNGTEVPGTPVADCHGGDLLTVRAEAEFTLVTPIVAQILGDRTISGDASVTVN